jgi:hypothetical protein
MKIKKRFLPKMCYGFLASEVDWNAVRLRYLPIFQTYEIFDPQRN